MLSSWILLSVLIVSGFEIHIPRRKPNSLAWVTRPSIDQNRWHLDYHDAEALPNGAELGTFTTRRCERGPGGVKQPTSTWNIVKIPFNKFGE